MGDDGRQETAGYGLRLWLPLMIFVGLLAAGTAIGRYVIPVTAPAAGATPSVGIDMPEPSPSLSPPPPTPDPPVLPTTPPRPADQLAEWSYRVSSSVNVPAVAIQAYGYAQLVLARTDPQCRLSWTTLAGIGEVESRHGQAGRTLGPNGRSTPVVIGQPLDGKEGRPLVRDTDAGAYDGDTEYDRMMGPLSLTPTMWREYGIDADGDGILDPYDIDDAALALARLLCSGEEDLSHRSGWEKAIARYRASRDYARSVFLAADRYGRRTEGIR